MNEPDLWMLSLNAFAAVVVLLSALALVLAALVRVFPADAEARAGTASTDPAYEAAIRRAVEQVAPGARVTAVREVHEGGPR